MSSHRRPNAGAIGALAIFVLGAAMASGAFAGFAPNPSAANPTATASVAAPTPAGSQGTDTALPATASQVTASGRGTFAGLAVTVNQTKNLTNQAVSITWTGGNQTIPGPGRFGQQYLQIMQCWGDPDTVTVPENPGPPPEQCEQGAVAGSPGGLPGGLYPAGFALSRVISRINWPNYDPNVGFSELTSPNVWMPFRAVDGTVVNAQSDSNFNPQFGGNFWLNPYYNQITTNEIAAAVTGPDGKGAELMQIYTGVQSSGLGCGQKVQPVAGGGTKAPQCWIVVVPRGLAVDEDAGTPFEATALQSGVVSSPVSPNAWKNRIAIPIDFNPAESPCELGHDERRITGSELALSAVASWQPQLCASLALPPFSFSPAGDAAARQQLASNLPGRPGMAAVSGPLDINTPDDPVVYAPLAVSGLVIGLNIERNPAPGAPDAEQVLDGVRVAHLNLTPRLVAKLLTQSYQAAVSINSSPGYAWAASNPAHMGLDPDFLRFNPEFSLLQIADSRTFAGLHIPSSNLDAIKELWAWIFADPEAKAFLGGQADEWGMQVNPMYATDAAKNPSGTVFGDPLPTSFPKADPYCYQAPSFGPNNSVVPPLLCGTDWLPYTRGLDDSAAITRTAADGAKVDINLQAQTSSDVWKREPPQFLGRRDMLAITDVPSATRFGVQIASLSRAGDNGADRAFVDADAAGLAAGVAAMKPQAEPQVLEPDPTATAPTAYPLTTVVYGAVRPLSLSAAERNDFSAFINYASGPGQVPGLELGQLPRGYAALPAGLKAQAQAAAATVVSITAPPTTTTTATSTTQIATPISSSGGTVRRTGGGSTGSVPPAPATTVQSSTPTVAPTSSVAPTVVPTTEPATTTTAVLTPGVSASASRLAVPGLGLMALGSALGALEITKRPRRRTHPDDAADDGGEGSS